MYTKVIMLATYSAVLGLLFCVESSAQSLSVPETTARRGGTGSFLLKFESGSGKAPAALQWRFVFPAGMSVETSDIVAGSAAGSKQSLTCSLVKDPKRANSGVTAACVLAGGDGPV